MNVQSHLFSTVFISSLLLCCGLQNCHGTTMHDTLTVITICIFNTMGQKVNTLVDDVQIAGAYSVSWDGKDDHGLDVTSGLYFYTLKAGTFWETRKMVLLK